MTSPASAKGSAGIEPSTRNRHKAALTATLRHTWLAQTRSPPASSSGLSQQAFGAGGSRDSLLVGGLVLRPLPGALQPSTLAAAVEQSCRPTSSAFSFVTTDELQEPARLRGQCRLVAHHRADVGEVADPRWAAHSTDVFVIAAWFGFVRIRREALAEWCIEWVEAWHDRRQDWLNLEPFQGPVLPHGPSPTPFGFSQL